MSENKTIELNLYMSDEDKYGYLWCLLNSMPDLNYAVAIKLMNEIEQKLSDKKLNEYWKIYISDNNKLSSDDSIQAHNAIYFDNLLFEDIITNIKKGISNILLGAVNGLNNCYRTKDGYIRWGLVENDIYKLIDDKLKGES